MMKRKKQELYIFIWSGREMSSIPTIGLSFEDAIPLIAEENSNLPHKTLSEVVCPSLVLIYSNDCYWCQKFKSKYVELDIVSKYRIDGKKSRNLIKLFNVTHYPSLYYLRRNTEAIYYTGANEISDIEQWYQKQMKIRSKK